MSTILSIILAIFIVSLISLIGALTISWSHLKIKKILNLFVSFAAGALLGDSLLHLLPEVSAEGLNLSLSIFIITGILIFFILEKFLHWQHCHEPTSATHPHPLATINLVGDFLHNIIDGFLIAGSFLVSPSLGFATTLAVALHEIPQEIGDFSVLLYAGYTRTRALLLNFLTALSAFIGAGLMLLLSNYINNSLTSILALTAGSFIYIALTDLIPELHKETSPVKSFTQIISLLLGLTVMALLLLVE